MTPSPRDVVCFPTGHCLGLFWSIYQSVEIGNDLLHEWIDVVKDLRDEIADLNREIVALNSEIVALRDLS